MNDSVLKGFGFGLTSGVITTLGLIVGLHSGTGSRNVIIAGILVIAIADALSDSLGIHISEESGNSDKKNIWTATIATLLSKFVFALTFIVPIMILELSTAIIVSIIWGLFLIATFSYYIAKKQKEAPYKAVLEHLVIAIVVIILTHVVGQWATSIG